MNPIRLMGKAFYNKWIESVTRCEPKFEELPECYLLQLDDCMRAAVRALAASDRIGDEMVHRALCGYLVAVEEEGDPSLMPSEENIGAPDAA
jgi:hypothetical protein